MVLGIRVEVVGRLAVGRRVEAVGHHDVVAFGDEQVDHS